MRQLPQKYKRLALEISHTFKLPRKKSPHTIAIGPFGPCCIGKTTTMTYIARQLPVVHINHDKIRLFMTKKKIPKTEQVEILYKHLLIVHLAKQHICKGYSVILDRDFGTNNRNLLIATKRETKKLMARFFLIQIKAPQWFIKRKIQTRRLIPPKTGGIQDRKTAMACYLYSLKHYKNNYIRLLPQAIAIVDTSKPIPFQLKEPLKLLKREMGL